MVTSPIDLKALKRRVRRKLPDYRRFARQVKKYPLPVAAFVREVTQIQQKTDCTSCANCCKTMRVPVTGADSRRIAQHLGMPLSHFRKKYVTYDKKDKHDEIIAEPCPFLRADNLCGIYEVRPRGCRGYPFMTAREPLDYRVPWMIEHAELCPIIEGALNAAQHMHDQTHRPVR